MKHVFLKVIAIVLSLVMALTTLSACGNSAEPAMDEIVDAAVKAALEAAVVPTTVTIDADGRQVTIEDAADKSVQQLLDQADIALNEGDVVSVSPAQTLTGNITIQVLRRNIVTVKVEGEEAAQYTAVLLDGIVADALAIVGIELAENQLVNYELDQALEDGIEIVISVEEEVEETEPEETESSSSSSSSSSSGSSSSGSSSSGSSSSGSSSSGSSSSGSSSSGSSSSGSSSSGGSSSGGSSSGGSSSGESSGESSGDSGSSSGSERTVVSVVYYEDCDGSGHGVKVITYSDGTQEEVPY